MKDNNYMKNKLANTPRSTASLAAAAVLAILFAASTSLQAAPPLPGAVFTTDSTCSGVDLNIYGAKSEVYLDGGPSHPGAASLPDGNYYVQVTDPSGACVLGTSIGTADEQPFKVSNNGATIPCIQLCTVLINGPAACALNGVTDANCGYNDTTNPGGEYKVWVSSVPTFDNNSTKTDNFKVKANPPPPVTLCVDKFYDANVNGQKDPGEVSINGWLFHVFADDNLYLTRESPFCVVVDPGSYHVTEADAIETNWLHTTDTNVYVTLPPDANLEFGNVCLGAGGGLTLGFWSNRNGQNLENAADFTALNLLCLRNATGANQDFTGTLAQQKTALNTWLLNANAINMAYMLSAQLTAMELNVRHAFVNGTKLVYGGDCVKAYQQSQQLPGSNGFITINDLMTAANNELCLHGLTPSGNQFRAYQECLKTTLDDANNNKNFVQSTPCPFSFAAGAP
jgi:hypothetical protein